MSVLWTSGTAARVTGGRTTRDWTAGGVSIDTRSLVPGDLFVALTDARDGHDFVAEALAKGAAAAMVARVPEGVAPDAPLLLVDDVLTGLVALAAEARMRTRARVVGVTGSAGKTSTKEMLVAALTAQGRVHAAEKSFNNHWGVPLTLARMPAETDFAVIEIGMNHPGEITPLTQLARPDIAIVTTVAAAHLEAFPDGIQGIARAKAEIFAGLAPGGTAIVNGDIATLPILRAAAEARGARLVTFGTAEGCDVRLLTLTPAAGLSVVQGAIHGVDLLFKVGSPGRHFAMNALAVLAAVEALGADRALAMMALAAWSPPAGRGNRDWIRLDSHEDGAGLDLIDDAFNANPASMAAALDVLAAAEPVDGIGRVSRGRRIAILGDMLELGPDEGALHAAIADDPAMERIAVVHCVGPRMRALWQALPPGRQGEWTETADDLAQRVHGLVDPGDVVLVKGSKGSRVSRVVDAIRKLGQAVAKEDRGTD